MSAKRVYVTKYALTLGIWDCTLDSQDEKYVWVRVSGGMNGTMMFAKNDFHYTIEAAQKRVEEMVQAKLASIEKQAKKLRQLCPAKIVLKH